MTRPLVSGCPALPGSTRRLRNSTWESTHNVPSHGTDSVHGGAELGAESESWAPVLTLVGRVLAPAPANGAALNVSTGAQSSPKTPCRVELLGALHGVPRASAVRSWPVVARTVVTTYTRSSAGLTRFPAGTSMGGTESWAPVMTPVAIKKWRPIGRLFFLRVQIYDFRITSLKRLSWLPNCNQSKCCKDRRACADPISSVAISGPPQKLRVAGYP